MAEPRDLAVRWLAARLANVTCEHVYLNPAGAFGQPDACSTCLAAAILDQPGMEVDVEYLRVTPDDTMPSSYSFATHQQIVIRMPFEQVGAPDAS